MSDVAIIGIGFAIFAVISLVSLQFGYAAFGSWYDRDKAEEFDRRRKAADDAHAHGAPSPEREPGRISHDRPDRLEDIADHEQDRDAREGAWSHTTVAEDTINR